MAPHHPTEPATVWQAFRKPLTTAALFGVAANLVALASPLGGILAYDRLTASDGSATAFLIALIALALFAAHTLLTFTRARLLARVGRRVGAALTDRFGDCDLIERLPARDPATGALQNRYRDLASVRGFLAGPTTGPMLDLPWLPIYALSLAVAHPGLGAMALVGLSALLALGAAEAISSEDGDDAAPAALPDSSLWSMADDFSGLAAVGLEFCRVVYQALLLGVALVLVQRGELSPGILPGVFIIGGVTMRTAQQTLALRAESVAAWAAYRRLTGRVLNRTDLADGRVISLNRTVG
jgi:ABC-type protease/lipase transport system fused ATPase/permease subunit